MRLWKALVAGALVFLAALAGMRATRSRQKAMAIADRSEEALVHDVLHGTDEARERAAKAMAHIDRAKDAERKLEERLTKGAAIDETVESAFDRYRSRARRMQRDDAAS